MPEKVAVAATLTRMTWAARVPEPDRVAVAAYAVVEVVLSTPFPDNPASAVN